MKKWYKIIVLLFFIFILIVSLSGCSNYLQSSSFKTDIPSLNTKLSRNGMSRSLAFETEIPSPNIRFSLSPFDSTQMIYNPAPSDVSITLTLPMYPNSLENIGTNHQQPPSFPNVSYMYEGASNSFLVPASEQVAETWFKHQLVLIGYSQTSGGSFGNFKKQITTDFLSFKNPKNPDVILTFLQKDSNQTIVQYFGEYVIPPARPSDSLLPSTIEEIDIGYSLFNSMGKFISKPMVITNLSVIKLVNAVNEMTVDTANPHSMPCIGPDTKEQTLKFSTSNKDIYTMTIFSGFTLTHNGKTFSLADSDNDFYPLIEQIYGKT